MLLSNQKYKYEGKMYKTEFKEAELRTKRLELLSPPTIFTEKRYLTKKAASELHYYIRDKIGTLTEDDMANQCLSLHVRLKPIISEYFNCPVYLTIGYVEFDGDDMYKQNEDSLRMMIENGISGKSVDLHAWLTLPSMEILDFSLATSYGKRHGKHEMIGNVMAVHTNQLPAGLKYKPMLIGKDFLIRTGAMKFSVEMY